MAEKIAAELKTPLANSETVRFADGEVRVRILENVADQVCVIVQSTSTPGDANLMELYQFGDLLKKGKAKKIIAVVPYLAYSRQDKAHREGEEISARLVARMLEFNGITDIVLLDLHSQAVVNFFKIPTINLSAIETMAQYIDGHRDDFGSDDLVIVAPDEGAKTKAEELARILEVDAAYLKKDRPLNETDVIPGSNLVLQEGTVKNKEAIIIDDMISTGGTSVTAANLILQNGAYHVFLMATHAVLSRGEPSFWQNSPFEKIFVTDSIFVPKYKQFEKLQVISVAPVIAKSLQNLV